VLPTTAALCLIWFLKPIKKLFLMYFSETYSFFFLDGFFHILYLFEKWEIFMPHPVLCLSCYFGICSCHFVRHYVIYETQKLPLCSKETNYFRLETLPETHNTSLVYVVTAAKLMTWIHRPYWPKCNWTETTIPHGQSLLGSVHAPRTIYSLLSHAPTNRTTFRLANNFCNWLATL